MLLLDGKVVEPTRFPDGTSQVWKLPQREKECCVEWVFQGEDELVQLMQLLHLLRVEGAVVTLVMRWLPYGRQDKEVSNGTTFGLKTFGEMLQLFRVNLVVTFDAHNASVLRQYVPVFNEPADQAIKWAWSACGMDAMCFPDAGAQGRYGGLCSNSICLEKVRNQSTGEIEGLRIASGSLNDESSVLIVDDICDGGRTFIEAAKLLKGIKPELSVHLYVSHGIFSKGLRVLRDAGIERIFTKDGEVGESLSAY